MTLERVRKFNQFFFSTLVISNLSVVSFAMAAGKSAAPASGVTCSTLYQDLWQHSVKAMKSQEKTTTYFYWGRARLAIEATPPEKLAEIFKKMSKSDLENLFWGVKAGDIKATRDEEKMIEELWHMVDDLGEKPFWGPAPDRAYAIQQALRAHDAKLTYSGNPAFAAELTDQALGKTELEMLARAMGEHERNAKYPNSKFFDRIVRFFSPHYDKVKDVLSTNNSIRRRLQTMYEADRPALDAIAKYEKDLKLSSGELRDLQAQASDTAGLLSEARKDIEALYGREVSTSEPLPEAEIRIRELAKRAASLGSGKKETELRNLSESDMDTIDRVIGTAWDRTKGTTTGMPLSEKHDVHLQIRNPQYRRETPERRAAYLGVTKPRSPNQSEYDVVTEWVVTVKHEEPKTRQVPKPVYNEKGEQTGTKMETEHYTDYYDTTYTMNRDDQLRARYEEVLQNSVNPSDHVSDLPALPTAQKRGAYAVSASNGEPYIDSYSTDQVSRILQNGSTARSSETPYRDRIAAATKLVDAVTNETYKVALKEPGGAKKILGEFEAEEKRLRAARAELASYQATDASRIRSQWSSDKEKDFRDRNQQMLNRFDHMITRISHAAEQVRRETPSLEIEHTLPGYDAQMARLKEIRDKNRRIIRNTAIGSAATGVGTAGVVYREEIKGFIHDLTNSGGY